MTKNLRAYLPYLYIAVIAFLSLAVCSNTTSPFYTEQNMADSGMFQIIGKYWAQGHLPYIELWDSKGPLVFFGNCLGYMLTGNSTGVFVVQCLCLFVTLAIILRILRHCFSTIVGCALLLIPLAAFSANISGGNCVEEFELPFIALAYLCVCHWLWSDKSRGDHPSRYAFVYGIVLGLSFMSRLTNALGVCAAVAVIACWLVYNRKWQSLLKNILMFVAGLAISTLPFVIYFYANGALDALWYSAIVYNFDYAAHAAAKTITIKDFFVMVTNYLDTFLMLFTSIMILLFNRKRWLSGILWLLVSALSLFWLLGGKAYAHYGLVSMPLVAVSFVELYNMIVTNRNKASRYIIKIVSVGYILVTAMVCYRGYTLKVYEDNSIASLRSFMKDVPASYKKSFVFYNGGTDLYLFEDIMPACRFFTFQDWEAACSSSLISIMKKSFHDADVQWILVSGKPVIIAQMLNNDYKVYKSEGELTLYHIK